MPKAGQDINDPNDPTNPYNRVRQNVLTQAGGTTDPAAPPPPSSPSTPSPNFTTQPVASTPLPPSPTVTTNPVPNGTTRGPGTTTAPFTPTAGTVTGTNPSGFPTVTWQPGQGPVIPGNGAPASSIPGLPTGSNPTGAPAGGGSAATTPAPSYVNAADPVQAAVWKAFQAKGITPRDASDFQYWVNKASTTNGGWTNPDNQKYWLDRMAQSQGGVGDYQERPEAGAAAGTGATGATTTPYAEQVRKMLMDRMGELSKPLDVNDPTITEPFGAANLAAQRQLEQGKKDTAERLYASGNLNTNAAQMEGTQANERAATGLAGVKANLIANQLTQRANQLQQLYSLAVASGDSESARQVQLELASIQAELAREGFGVTLGLGQAELNARATTPLLTA